MSLGARRRYLVADRASLQVEEPMELPACRTHGRLMLDLARGRLAGREGLEAEAIRRRCPACDGWWRRQFAGDRAAAVEEAVGEAFSAFAPPRPKRLPEWLPLAVAAVLALALGLALRLFETDPASAPTANRESPLVQELFEADLNGDGTVDLSDLTLDALEVVGPEADEVRSASAAAGEEPQPIFGENLETGDLSSWSSYNPSGPGSTRNPHPG